MATTTIRKLFFSPPVVIARLGGSATPLDAFDWVMTDPHRMAETGVRPAWTLDVQPDGTVVPRLPTDLVLRDGPAIRPVAPFLELWALVGDGPPAGLAQVPVTVELLRQNGAVLGSLTFTVEAMNRKAARRAGAPGLRFGTFPPVSVRADTHSARPLNGVSPPGVANPMIPPGRSIPLGRFQVIRPRAQPAGQAWSGVVRVDTVRVRFTPPEGRFYGPPQAAQTTGGQPAAPVPASRAFLDPAAGWFGATTPDQPRVVPADTFDGVGDQSLGVVDDTSDIRIVASLALGGTSLTCRANVMVGPPDFSPDRRPFISAADEINDRQHDPARDTALTAAQRADWVEDLFERVFETVSLLDVDFYRSGLARQLTGAEVTPTTIPGDGVPEPTRAMGGRDALRDRTVAVAGPTAQAPRPLSTRGRDRHRDLADIALLEAWVRANPGRIRQLVRPPFQPDPGDPRRANQTMRMPPFMRNSNGRELTLTRWQYDLLLSWVDDVLSPSPRLGVAPVEDLPNLSNRAAARRARVLQAMEDGQ